MDSYNGLMTKIRQRSAKTVVIGLGYVGLPLAVLAAHAGFKVMGIERNPDRVARINRGESYINEVVDVELAPLVKDGRLRATSEFSSISEADVIAICVPTPLEMNKQPDISYIKHVLDQARPYWHAGQLVILESTTYPGTTEEVLLPRLTASGLEVGQDVFIAFCPERIDPGNKEFQVGDIPRIVGGITPRCTEIARYFYQQVLRAEAIPVSSPKVAEMTKLFENVFRVVNVSLVNELAQLCERMGIDVWEVIKAAETKPFGFMPFYPGPGVGGHCIPVDPFFLSWKAREFGFSARFIELAGEINDSMPGYVVEEVSKLLNSYEKPVKGSRVLMIGVAFKRDVGDTRESAAIKVAENLLQLGANLDYHDPHVPAIVIGGHRYESIELNAEHLQNSDLVVITTDHSCVDYRLIAENSGLVYDTRNALKDYRAAHIHRLGAPNPS